MKIKSINKVKLENPKQYYDVINAYPYNNFLIETNTSFVGSHNCIFANFTDEVNFGLTSDVEKLKKKQKSLISQIDARMKSRFLRGTYLPTLNIIASSKNSEQSFLEDFIDSKRKNESKNTLIIDEPQWVVDSRKDSENRFWVAIGNKLLANELLPLDAPDFLVQEYRARGYNMLSVPEGYYENFVENLDGSLQDIAGIATASSLKYISGKKWLDCVSDDMSNPFSKEVLKVGDSKDDKVQYSDFFDLSKISPELKSRPLYIHLDMSVSGDKTGIAGVWIIRKQAQSVEADQSKSLFFKVAFSCAIEAPRGAQISFNKNKQFIYWIKEQGFNLKKVTSDTYQSAPVLQDLRAHNIDCEILSVDRLTGEGKNKICEPYHYFKSTIYEGRIECYKTELLTNEIVGLERLSDGHIDHTTSGINSKDISDAVCGATYEASKHAEQYAFEYGEDLETAMNVSNSVGQTSQNQITLDFEAELKKVFNAENTSAKAKELDFGMGPAISVDNGAMISQGIMVW